MQEEPNQEISADSFYAEQKDPKPLGIMAYATALGNGVREALKVAVGDKHNYFIGKEPASLIKATWEEGAGEVTNGIRMVWKDRHQTAMELGMEWPEHYEESLEKLARSRNVEMETMWSAYLTFKAKNPDMSYMDFRFGINNIGDNGWKTKGQKKIINAAKKAYRKIKDAMRAETMAREEAEAPQTRRKPLQEKMKNMPFDQEEVLNEVVMDFKNNPFPKLFIITKLKQLPKEQRAAFRKELSKRLHLEFSTKEWAKRLKIMDMGMKTIYASKLQPVQLLEEYVSDADIQIEIPEGLQDKLLQKTEAEELIGHGIERNKGGIMNLLNIMVEGEITLRTNPTHYGVGVGGINTNNDGTYSAGAHGPYYVVLDRGYNIKYAEVVHIPEEAHIAYIVPTETQRICLTGALNRAEKIGLVTHNEAVMLLSKVVIYQEVIDAPKGEFTKYGIFVNSRMGQAERSLTQVKTEEGDRQQKRLAELIACGMERKAAAAQAAREIAETRSTAVKKPGVQNITYESMVSDSGDLVISV